MISGKTRIAGIFASPVSHSLSPLMHNTAFQARSIDAIYLAFTVDQTNLKQAVESIRTFNMLGVNLSMPNKIAVIPYLDELSQEAQLIGAVNTIVHRDNRLIGYNTDGMGFMRSVNEAGIAIKDKKVTMLGAGGAAKAIVVQAALDQAKEIVIYKRKNATFASVASTFQKIAEQTGCHITIKDYADTEQLKKNLEDTDLLINGTDMGMGEKKEMVPIDPQLLHPKIAVFDLIYSPRETRFLKEAKAQGCLTRNGLGMLLYQGAIAFELWTGQTMPIEKIQPLLDSKE
ncbi:MULTISPECIES: shikimate dehydrogenase [unclassified Enterococcus]|uniref:shikimate dehydrogenase n=1 Tax=unclassified Enterococcus TaxID=2608891 RepID=UPI001A9BD27B|nr:shikimate dehydrogenase [Enterococcus sp. DIV1271a]MBO1299401.1 shikimate dehydrogenase [Enterococcus sp. DIV1271a]